MCSSYCDDIDRITSDGYVPTDQDLLQLHFPKTEIVREILTTHDFAYVIDDIGGDLAEGSKWALYFENADAIIFPVDISTYDQRYREISLRGAFDLFDSICKNPRLHGKPIIFDHK